MVRSRARLSRTAVAAGLALGLLCHEAFAGGTMRVATSILPPKMSPYGGITLPAILPTQAIFDTLTTYDAQGNVSPALALEWRAEDAKHWIFKLRPGVKFTNGEPFDAEAVVASSRFLVSQEGRAETIGSTLYQLEKAEVVDPLTVRVTLREADALFPLHATVWRVAAPKLFAQLGFDGYLQQPIGTGPFIMANRTESRMELKANKDSWRAPKLDGLTILKSAEEVSRIQALVSGAVDVALRLDIESRETVEAAGATFHRSQSSMVYFLGYHTRLEKSPLKDARVRRALNMAVNKQAIIDTAFGGQNKPAAQLTFPGAFGFDPKLQPFPYDPAAAKRLLAEAGYPNGFSVKLGVANSRTAAEGLSYQQIAVDLAKIGVKMEIELVPPFKLQQDQFTGHLTFDMFATASRGFDPIMDYRHRSCTGAVPDRNPYHCDQAILATVRKAMSEEDFDKRKALYAEVANQEKESPPGLYLWQWVEFDGFGKRVKAMTMNLETANVHEWDLK